MVEAPKKIRGGVSAARKAPARRGVGSHMSALLELTSMAAVTVASWVAGALVRSRVERSWERLRHRRLDALPGQRDGDVVHHVSGARLTVEPEGRGYRLSVAAELEALPDGLDLDARVLVESRPREPAATALGLALAREGLLRAELEVRTWGGAVRVSQWTEALPTEARMNGLAHRLAQAVAHAATYLGAGDPGDTRRRAAVSGLLSPDPLVRVASAELAGSLGVPVLRQVLLDPQVDLELRERAGRAFAVRARPAELREVYLEVMRSAPEALARYAAAAHAESDAPIHLVALLWRVQPAAQRQLLDHLAEVGGADVHAALEDLLNRGGLGVRMDGPLRNAWRRTKKRRDARRGRLALVETPGRLSIPWTAATNGGPDDS